MRVFLPALPWLALIVAGLCWPALAAPPGEPAEPRRPIRLPSPAAEPKPAPEVLLAPELAKTLLAFQLGGVWFIDPRNSKDVAQASNHTGKWQWPPAGGYDIHPKLVHLVWDPVRFPQDEIAKLIASSGYWMRFKLNGKTLAQGPNASSGDFHAGTMQGGQYGCPQGTTCMVTSVLAAPWFSAAAPWTVDATFAAKVKKGEEPLERKFGAVIHRPMPEMSYFKTHLFQIFQHDRCKTCHTLGTAAAVQERHGGIIGQEISSTPATTAEGTTISCNSGCHWDVALGQVVPGVEFHDVEWKSPGFDLGLDWRNKTPQYICQKVNATLPTPQAKKKHFHEDARIAWAVHSGKLPLGRGTLPVAGPGDYFEFVQRVDAWIDHGSPCPK